jgi:UDP-GlcNAc:undecaprenyl-phosphate GlcNAc-1-phosphate transferase
MSLLEQLLMLIGIFISSAFLCKLLYEYSFNLGSRNLKEEELRWQARKPSLGGLNFIFIFIIFSIAHILFDQNVELKNNALLKSLLIGSFASFIIGFVDDVRNTNPLLKLIGQILCGIILVGFGVVIPISPNIYWNSLLTVSWIVFLMNSINMIDNIDGLATSISVLIMLTVMAYIYLFNLTAMVPYVVYILIMIGAMLGFLMFNWHPSKIYMGDSGSQFLGYMLGAFSVYMIWGNKTAEGGYFQLNQFILPIYVFAVPIFDTGTVFIHRILRKQSPFVGGRDHLSHLFSMKTGSDIISVGILILIQVLFCVIGLLGYLYPTEFIFPLLLSFFVLFFLAIQWIYTQNKKALLER